MKRFRLFAWNPSLIHFIFEYGSWIRPGPGFVQDTGPGVSWIQVLNLSWIRDLDLFLTWVLILSWTRGLDLFWTRVLNLAWILVLNSSWILYTELDRWRSYLIIFKVLPIKLFYWKIFRWSAKNRFQLSACSNLETLNHILCWIHHVWFFKYGHGKFW